MTIFGQKGRETPLERARRGVIRAQGALEVVMQLLEDEMMSPLWRDNPHAFFGRVLQPLFTAHAWASTLIEAYDYYLARCAEAGIPAERAHAVWEEYSTPAFEAEVVEVYDLGYFPNIMQRIDEQILVHLGVGPHDNGTDA